MMNLCHQLSFYNQEILTLLALVFTMGALSKIAKKHREETAYTALVGVSLMSLVNVFLDAPLSAVVKLVKSPENSLVHALWISVVATVIIVALLMLVGKILKVKAVAPKTLAICFFVGIALANLVGMAINHSCSAPKTEKHK